MAWVVAGRDPEDLALEAVSGVDADLDDAARVPRCPSRCRRGSCAAGEAMAVDDLGTEPGRRRPVRRARAAAARPGDRGAAAAREGCPGCADAGLDCRSTPHARRSSTRRCPPASPSRRRWRCRSRRPARTSSACRLRGPGPDRARPARPGDPAAVRRRPRAGGRRALGDRPDGRRAARQAVDDLDATIKDIRRTIFALGSLAGSADLQAEVTRLVERAAATLKFRPTLRSRARCAPSCPTHVAPDLLAVLGEALSNASRHADASSVDVSVSVGDEVGWRSSTTAAASPTTSGRAGWATCANGRSSTAARSR